MYDSSVAKLKRAMREMDILRAYDNTRLYAEHRLVLEVSDGKIIYVADPVPDLLVSELIDEV